MSKTSEYLCTENVVKILEQTKLSLNSYRLVHALLFVIDQSPALDFTRMALPNAKALNVRSVRVLHCAYPPGTNDLDPLHEAVDELAQSSLFTTLELDESSRWLTFLLAPHLAKAAIRLRGYKFAMVDMDVVQSLSSPTQILLYVRSAMLERSDYPTFWLPGIEPDGETWLKSKRRWIGAAERLSRDRGFKYLILPEHEPFTERVLSVKVKLAHDKTLWCPEKLYPRASAALPTVVIGGHSKRLSRAELAKRRTWTKIDRP